MEKSVYCFCPIIYVTFLKHACEEMILLCHILPSVLLKEKTKPNQQKPNQTKQYTNTASPCSAEFNDLIDHNVDQIA